MLDLHVALDEASGLSLKMSDISVRRWSGEWRRLKRQLRIVCYSLGEFNDDPERSPKLYRETTVFSEYIERIIVHRKAQGAFRRLRKRYCLNVN